jgi:hypothetical protein
MTRSKEYREALHRAETLDYVWDGEAPGHRHRKDKETKKSCNGIPTRYNASLR